MIVDAKDTILGRLAAYVAKQALMGNEVTVVNSEQAVITGKRDHVLAEYKRMDDMGTFKGPFLPKRADMLVRRTIRGMLPVKQTRGQEAFKRIKCYVGNKTEGAAVKVDKADVSKLKTLNYVYVKDIVKSLGGKE
ncbi:50S ribosomal protein L13 [Candidatus Woesearchaeota archaeon]|nr:50S ribosomal protein L13 [Candidatus Woesearchaeota archaeon]